MKKIVLSVLTILTLITVSCTNDDINIPEEIEVQDFIWKGLNLYYFWQEDVPDLANDRFSNQGQLNNFLNNYDDPKDLFDALKFNPGQEGGDKYSWIVDDYIELEQQLQGTSKNNGVKYGLVPFSGGNDLFGYVQYISPNSDASNKDIKRGDLFLEVDGQQLTLDNYRDLLFGANDSYTLGLASIDNTTISLTGETVSLTKEIYTENPVFLTKTIDKGGKKIGYIMYNAFRANFETELNNAFLQLKNEGVTDLVLDLRYNGGGRISTATSLASMITGQFEGELFSKESWNSKLQEFLEEEFPERLTNNFGSTIENNSIINSLNLTKLYVLVTKRSASASELVINGLKPYIDVTLVGSKTEGKHVGSVTLYDSENFLRTGANQNHFYAMQPIVLQEVNKLGENNNNTGFDPNIPLAEDYGNLGVLGDEDEPLLEAALNDILGMSTPVKRKSFFSGLKEIGHSEEMLYLHSGMYIKKDLDFKALLLDANR